MITLPCLKNNNTTEFTPLPQLPIPTLPLPLRCYRCRIPLPPFPAFASFSDLDYALPLPAHACSHMYKEPRMPEGPLRLPEIHSTSIAHGVVDDVHNHVHLSNSPRHYIQSHHSCHIPAFHNPRHPHIAAHNYIHAN